MRNRKIAEICTLSVGIALLLVGLAFFVRGNWALFNHPVLIACLFGGESLSLLLFFVLLCNKEFHGNRILKKSGYAVSALLLVSLVALALCTVVINMFQPLTLLTMPTGLMIAGVVVMVAGMVLGFTQKTRSLFAIVLSAHVFALMLTGIVWANTQNYAQFHNLANDPVYLFQNGESGYYTFRIPSLIALDKDSLNEKRGFSLQNDLLLATAEGRKNSSRDTGDIDIVGKLSANGGKTWSELFVLFSVDGEVGKCGNPTAAIDEVNALLYFVYMTATEASGFDYRTYCAVGTPNPDNTFTWNKTTSLNYSLSENVTTGSFDGVNENTVMAGPGKALISEGRLIVPCSRQGVSFAMYSDDGGANWTRGSDACSGNECEIARLSNGELLMVSRDNTGCTSYHPEQYQRICKSADNGATWYLSAQNTTLKSPICMSSLAIGKDGAVYLSYPDDFFTRANLSVGVSRDSAATFSSKRLYDGASGYSCVTADSDGNVFVLAEIGKVNYNEVLVFLKLAV